MDVAAVCAVDSGANMYLLQHTLTSDMMLQPTKMSWPKVKNQNNVHMDT